MEKLCEIQVRKRSRSRDYFVSINYGDGKGWNCLLTSNEDKYTCDSEVQPMNYMAKQGWKMIKIFRDIDSDRYYRYEIFFKKNTHNKKK